jgi:hypothetical protein
VTVNSQVEEKTGTGLHSELLSPKAPTTMVTENDACNGIDDIPTGRINIPEEEETTSLAPVPVKEVV